MCDVLPVSVQRRAEGRYEISWESSDGRAPRAVLAGKTPHAFDRTFPITAGSNSNPITLSGLNPDCHYFFKIVLNDHETVTVADRRVPLDRVPNFRDMGGYPAGNGTCTKWGQVYRSGHLAEVTSRDQSILRQIGIRRVCDFRSEQEVNGQPNRLPGDTMIVYSRLPIVNKAIEPTLAVSRIRNGDISWFSEDFAIQSYLQQVNDFADVWHTFFVHLFDPGNRPFLFHCTAGKDRTGVAAALMLLSLGVSVETVIQDFALSNTYNAPFILKVRREISELGINPDDLHDFIVAPTQAITALIEHLEKHFGSASQYLIQKAGIHESQLEKFRQEMLE